MKTATETESPTTIRPHRWLRRVLLAPVLLVGWAVCVFTAWGALGRLHWRLDYFSNFHTQYFVLLTGIAALAAVGRAWRHTALFGVAMAFNGVLVWPLLAPSGFNAAHAAGDGTARPALRVVQKNLLFSNDHHGPVADWLRAQDADVIVVQEMSDAWRGALEGRLTGHELYAPPVARRERHVAGVFVRRGISVLSHRFFGDAVPEKQMVEVVLDLPQFEDPVALVGLHTRAPVSAKWSWLRGLQLDELTVWSAARRRAGAGPQVVVGDLNATRWSAPLRDLLKATGLHDTAEGAGLVGTWPDPWPWSGLITLDHVLCSDDFAVTDRRTGPGLGSDHRGVVVDLRGRN